jgi:hypothetical protein
VADSLPPIIDRAEKQVLTNARKHAKRQTSQTQNPEQGKYCQTAKAML